MVEQSLHVALGKELTEYFRLIAILEGQLNDSVDEGGEEAGGLTLRRLLVWTEDVRLRMRLMGVLVGETASKSSRISHSPTFDLRLWQNRIEAAPS